MFCFKYFQHDFGNSIACFFFRTKKEKNYNNKHRKERIKKRMCFWLKEMLMAI